MNHEQLRALCMAATPGPWTTAEDDYGDEHWFGGTGEGQVWVNGFVNGGCKRHPKEWALLKADASYIAAMDPTTTLALLNRIAELEQDNQHLSDELKEIKMQRPYVLVETVHVKDAT